jgi:hypothetical protein
MQLNDVRLFCRLEKIGMTSATKSRLFSSSVGTIFLSAGAAVFGILNNSHWIMPFAAVFAMISCVGGVLFRSSRHAAELVDRTQKFPSKPKPISAPVFVEQSSPSAVKVRFSQVQTNTTLVAK